MVYVFILPLSFEFTHSIADMNTLLYLTLKGVTSCANSMVWTNKIQFQQDQEAKRGATAKGIMRRTVKPFPEDKLQVKT